MSNAVITSSGGKIFLFDGLGCGFCATDSLTGGGNACTADAEVAFTLGPVANLTFEASSGSTVGDSFTVRAFAGSTLLATRAIDFNDTLADFTGISGIIRLFIENNSTAGGAYFTTWDFVQGEFDVAPVPLPASVPLLAGALGLLGWASRRNKRAG